MHLAPASIRPALEESSTGRTFLAAVDQFLHQHGARTAMAYLPFAQLSWREDPNALLATIAAMVYSGVTGGAKLREARKRYRLLRLRIEIGLLELRKRTWRPGGLSTRPPAVLPTAVPWLPHMMRSTLHSRNCLLLSTAGASLRNRDIVHRRRRARPKAIAAWQAELSAGARTQQRQDMLRGLSGSPGVATGPVRVIHGPDDFGRLQPGDVLVCVYTDPVWTPLFSLACAVVSDTGGPLSHAAIVAREYGIPAVLGTQSATAALKDGDVVQVDGSQGVVSILDPVRVRNVG